MALLAAAYTVGLPAFAVVNKDRDHQGQIGLGEDWVERTMVPHTSQSTGARARASLDPTRRVRRAHAVPDLVVERTIVG
jgi:hypothetical protein